MTGRASTQLSCRAEETCPLLGVLHHPFTDDGAGYLRLVPSRHGKASSRAWATNVPAVRCLTSGWRVRKLTVTSLTSLAVTYAGMHARHPANRLIDWLGTTHCLYDPLDETDA